MSETETEKFETWLHEQELYPPFMNGTMLILASAWLDGKAIPEYARRLPAANYSLMLSLTNQYRLRHWPRRRTT